MKTPLLALSLLLLTLQVAAAESIDSFASDFWRWRSVEQPVTSDDIPRIERPESWTPDWSPAALTRYRQKLAEFEGRLRQIEMKSTPVSQRVDYQLLQSAVARVRWELEVLHLPERNPAFYVDQTLGAYYVGLLPPPPFTTERANQLLAILDSIPATIDAAKVNLSDSRAPFTQIALSELDSCQTRLEKSVQQLKPLLPAEVAAKFDKSSARAAQALESYTGWLNSKISGMSAETAVGRDGYLFFLKHVALLPYTPEQLLTIGKQEWSRSVTGQLLEEHRDKGVAALPMFSTQEQQIQHETADESAIRDYLEKHDLLTVPSSIAHYRFVSIPSYVSSLGEFGEADDFTSPDRLQENGIRYIEPPGPGLGYFAKAMATDPRTLIVHEGVPGHYFQLALSWTNPDPIRRHYYDSSVNEGIGFYAEEMMLNAGLFDDSPRSREIIWNFMRLRALRVEVDVKLATGDFNLQQAAEYLAASVPMDRKTAEGEAAFFAATPGQAISYLIGKVQIEQLLADYQRKKGSHFDLRTFDDYVWKNGNVPIALQREELLSGSDNN